MPKKSPRAIAVPPFVAARRYPEAPWLYVCNYGRWQRHTKPAPVWIAVDTGLVAEPGKRAVWQALGPRGLEIWLQLLAEASRCGTDGLFWGDPRYLGSRLGWDAAVDLTPLIDAGWLCYLTDDQAEAIRAGGTLADLAAAEGRACEGCEGDRLRDELFEAIAAGLTGRWGKPRTSRRSEALYWRPTGKKGCQVRLALHKRRRSPDTLVDVILGDERSDIAVPLDGRVDPNWVVGRVIEAAGGGRTMVAGANVDGSPDPTGGGENAGVSEQRALMDVDGSPKKPRSRAVKGDSKRCAQKQDRTGQDSTVQDSTVQDSDKGQDRHREACAPEKSVPGCTGARRNPMKPEAGRSDGSPHQRASRASQASPGRRSGLQRIGQLCKPYWGDDDSVALGWEVFRALFPRRLDDDGDDAKSEVGTFAKIWYEEVKAAAPRSAWPVLRAKAIKHAREVAKSRSTRKPGAAWVTIFRKSIKARASPPAGAG